MREIAFESVKNLLFYAVLVLLFTCYKFSLDKSLNILMFGRFAKKYKILNSVFGLGLWLPELFIRFEKFQAQNPNLTVTVKQLAFTANAKNTTCVPSFETSVIVSTVVMGVTSLIVSALSGFLSSRVALKAIPVVTMFLGGISSGSIYWLTSSLQNMIVASIFQSTMVAANMSIGGAVVELFPTRVGGIAICLVMCAGRIGAAVSNVIFGAYMDKQCEIPIFVVAASVLFGALLCFWIPNKRKQRKPSESSEGKAIEISVIGADIS